MKPMDPAGEARRYATAQRVSWLLELSQADWTWRGATLATTFGGEAWPSRLAAVERWSEWLPETGREGGRARARAELRVPDPPVTAGTLRADLAVRAPVGIRAVLRLVWLDPQGRDAPAAAVMLRGRLTDWRVTASGVSLTLTDELEAIGNRRIGRLLRAGMLGNLDSPAMGRPLPWIFGALADAELVPLRAGATARLAAPVAAADTVIPLHALTGFPESGVAQIGAEVILYGAVDPTGRTLGTPQTPVVRGPGALDYRVGERVRQAPRGGFLWLVADHPCRAVGPVLADGMPVTAVAWEAFPLTLGGQVVEAVLLPNWPLNADGKPAERLSVGVEGLADAAGALIDNPARVLETLLTHERLGALAADRLDAVRLTAVADDLAARGYRFARRLTGDETLGELLDGAAEEAGLWIQPTDPLRLARADAVPHPAAAEEDLDATRLLEPAAPAQVRAPADYLPPDAVELVGAAPALGLPRPTWLFPPERLAEGTIPRRYALQWLDLSNAAAAGDLGELLWRRLDEAPFFHEQPYPLGVGALSCGDTVRLTDTALEMEETLGWVRRIEAGQSAGGPARARLEAWGPWSGAYCWQADRSNFIRRFAFGGHLLFVLGGRPVALLTRDGTLRLTGRLRERAAFSAGPLAEPIAIEDGWLVLGAGDAAPLTPFLRIDTGGNAELTGVVRERSTLAIDPAGRCHGAASTRFWFSTDDRTGALEWRADTATLHLPEILIERVRL